MVKNINNYLNFYHELRSPKNNFFDIHSDFEKPVYLITSPSRMGNHLIMSILDSHPNLPRIAGEDSFLASIFTKANYDISEITNNINNPDFFFKINFDGSNKWQKYFYNKNVNKKYSGIKIKKELALSDYKDLDIKIDYENYKKYFYNNFFDNNKNFFDIFKLYLNAFNFLDKDFKNKEKNYLYSSGFCFSGMRSQSLWLLENNINVKIICSLRKFESYAYAHILSRYGIEFINDHKKINEAFEHWFHKCIDYIFLKTNYSDKFLLLDFEDLQNNLKLCSKILIKFLGIPYNKCLYQATSFGQENKGNPSNSNLNNIKGEFYQSYKKISKKFILNYQSKINVIWNEFQRLKG